MKDWQSQDHLKWEFKYHVVMVPECPRRVFFGRQRKQIGKILRKLCRQKTIGLLKGNAQPDHLHMMLMLLSIPPAAHPGGVATFRPHATGRRIRGRCFGAAGRAAASPTDSRCGSSTGSC